MNHCVWWGDVNYKTCSQTHRIILGEEQRLARCFTSGEVVSGDPTKKCEFQNNFRFYSRNNCLIPCTLLGVGLVERTPGGTETKSDGVTAHSICVPKTPEEIEMGCKDCAR